MHRLRDLSEFTLDPAAIARLGLGFCKRKQVVLLGSFPDDEEAVVDVGMVTPDDQALIAVLRAHLNRPIQGHRLSPEAVAKALGASASATSSTRSSETSDTPELSLAGLDASHAATPIARALVDLLQRALAARATTLHLSCAHALAQARVDGRLTAITSPIRPSNAHAFVAHLLHCANLPTELTAPAQGRFAGQFVPAKGGPAREVSFGVVAIPTTHGPRVSITLDDAQTGALSLREIGMSEAQQRQALAALERPGVVFVAGPERAGRSTTLYALLEASADTQHACALVEPRPARPMDAAIERIRIHSPSDLDPQRWAQLWTADWDRLAFDPADAPHLQEALWNHEPAARSTLGVVRSFGSDALVEQLTARGVHRETLASGLRAVVHQRLLRRMCRACAVPSPTSSHSEALCTAWGRPLALLHPAGCDACGGLGYVGRLGIFEVSDWPARQRGTLGTHATLWAAGLARVEAGDTSLKELWAVLGPPPQSLPHASHAP